MWTAGAGFGGLVIAAVLWLVALPLVPDARGRSFASLSEPARRVLFTVAVLVGAGGSAAVAAVSPERPSAVAFAVFAAVTPCLATIDAVSHRLPYVATGGLAATALIAFGHEMVLSGESEALVRAGWAGIAAGAFGLTLWLVFPGEFGPGDIALLVVLGGFAGWISWTMVMRAVLAGFALGALAVGVARWGFRKKEALYPLGPFLLTGWWAAFALAVTG